MLIEALLVSFVPPIMPVSSPCSAACSPARMSNTCYLTACGPFGLGEAQKASLALPAAALVAYLNQPLPQYSTQNYCLYLICSLNTKLSLVSLFSLHRHAHTNISSVYDANTCLFY